jgi:hypothetical protein
VPANRTVAAAAAARKPRLADDRRLIEIIEFGGDELKKQTVTNTTRKNKAFVGRQRPYDQGVAEAKSAAYALLGKEVPLTSRHQL